MLKLLCFCCHYAGYVWVGLIFQARQFASEMSANHVFHLNSQEPTGHSPLIPNLLLDAEDDRGIDLDFLSEIVKLFDEQDDLKATIMITVAQLSQDLSELTMNDDYKPYVAVSLYALIMGCTL